MTVLILYAHKNLHWSYMIFYIAFKIKISSLKSGYIVFIYLFSFSLISQNEPKWVSPLEIPIQLSGTFGELRNNHFHAGLDIRTQGRQGLKVRCVQDGRVRRIRVSLGGYGKTLYIEHVLRSRSSSSRLVIVWRSSLASSFSRRMSLSVAVSRRLSSFSRDDDLSTY